MRIFIKTLIFRLIRPLFVKDICVNEDFECVECGEPVLKRMLYCSKKCYEKEPYNGN